MVNWSRGLVLSAGGAKRALAVAVVLVGCAALGVLALPTAAFAEDEGSARYELVYTGEFIDQEKQPIAGIFPLEFKLYDTAKGGKADWSEKHFVSVVDGTYTLVLGRKNPLPAEAAGKTLYLAVELDGAEMVRQPIKARLVSDEVRVDAGGTSRGTAQFAERAGDAETLGGFSPDDFAPAALQDTVERHVRNNQLHGGGGGGSGSLSDQTWKSDYSGGSGGKPYSLVCPDGFVVTGIEGRAGAVLDSIRVVCTKLE